MCFGSMIELLPIYIHGDAHKIHRPNPHLHRTAHLRSSNYYLLQLYRSFGVCVCAPGSPKVAWGLGSSSHEYTKNNSNTQHNSAVLCAHIM